MWNRKVKRLLVGVFCTVIILSSIAFSSKKQSDRMINDFYIEIDNQFENYFVDTEDIKSLINLEGDNYLLATSLGRLDLRQIEDRIRTNKFVSDVDAFTDHHGNLVVSISQFRPIARVFDANGKDYYIGATGEIMPVSSKYTARVLLVRFSNMKDLAKENLTSTEKGTKLLELLNFIDSNPFWKAQIAEMLVSRKMEVTLYPQITRQTIEFGAVDDIEGKFRRLMVFYKEILPIKGWNEYERVSLKYANQIVCE
jgi:cell division protein FtsQ